VDKSDLEIKENIIKCDYGHEFPIIKGIPVFITREMVPTIGCFYETLELVSNRSLLEEFISKADFGREFMQKKIVPACGNLYAHLNETQIPVLIPDIPLPIGNGNVMLDIGCFWGRWTLSAVKKNYFAIGVDPSLKAILAAYDLQKDMKNKADYLVADARYLPFRENVFDVVFSFSVFQHFCRKDYLASISEVGRTLKYGGYSLIQVVNRFGLKRLVTNFVDPKQESEQFGVRSYRTTEHLGFFENSVGSSSVILESYISINVQSGDIRLYSIVGKTIAFLSSLLKKVASLIPYLSNWADAIYIKSVKK